MDTLENFELIDSPQSSGLTEVVCLPLLEDSDLPLPEDHGEASSEEDAFQNATYPSQDFPFDPERTKPLLSLLTSILIH